MTETDYIQATNLARIGCAIDALNLVNMSNDNEGHRHELNQMIAKLGEWRIEIWRAMDL